MIILSQTHTISDLVEPSTMTQRWTVLIFLIFPLNTPNKQVFRRRCTSKKSLRRYLTSTSIVTSKLRKILREAFLNLFLDSQQRILSTKLSHRRWHLSIIGLQRWAQKLISTKQDVINHSQEQEINWLSIISSQKRH